MKFLLQLVCVFCNSTESRRRSIKIKTFVLLQFSLPEDRSQRSVELLQCDEDTDLTTRKWSMEETYKLIFFVYSMLASPKKTTVVVILRPLYF